MFYILENGKVLRVLHSKIVAYKFLDYLKTVYPSFVYSIIFRGV